jgi:methylthioribose-1-phosphate isomerase
LAQTDLHLENLPRTIALVRAGFSNFEELPVNEFGGHALNKQAFAAYKKYVEAAFVPAGIPVCVIVDQRALPTQETYLCTCDWREVMDWISTLAVRGAPAIGIAGACAVALRAYEYTYAQFDSERQTAVDFDRVFIVDETLTDPSLYKLGLGFAAKMIKKTRPTAVNLAWAVDQCTSLANKYVEGGKSAFDVAEGLFEFTQQLISQDEAACRAMGEFGASLLADKSAVLTHCNAGSLATSFYGTALGVIYSAAKQGKISQVFADETRPVGQGARLTCWELSRAGVDVTLICDNMAATVMAQGEVDAIFVGADRISANGDAANKIGTLSVAILAKHFNIPFYVVAPESSIDFTLESGAQIPIEERNKSEVSSFCADAHMSIYNPAFDVTPATLISAIVTETGIYKPDQIKSLRK